METFHYFRNKTY